MANRPIVKPAKVALQQLVTHLRCRICTKFPKNAHICPKCSEMYCYSCFGKIGLKKCRKCRSPLHLEQLIKLRCFETLDGINVGVDRLPMNDINSSPVLAVSSGGTRDTAINLDFVPDRKVIPVGRQEPIQGLPLAVKGTFTLRNINHCTLIWVYSERIVDEMGFMWRLKVKPNSYNGLLSIIQVYVEMLHGESGFFEIMLELTNFARKAILISDFIDTDNLVGDDTFLADLSFPSGNVNLNFRYTIRPANYRAKVLLQQRLLHKHAQQLETMKGHCDTFMYFIDNYHEANLQNEAFNEYVDQLKSIWRVGVHGKHDFTEFILILHKGPPGIYEITFILTHPTLGSEKRLHYAKRNIQINQRQLFNFGVRWSKLSSDGFVHDHGMVMVKVIVRPLHVDLKWVCNEFIDDNDYDDDDDDDDDYDDDDDDYDDDDDDYDDDDDDDDDEDYDDEDD